MRLKVPQYIDIEDKTIGPLTIKQFLYFLAGGAILFMLWFFLELALFILTAIPVVIICSLLAFYKFEGRPLITVLGAFLIFLSKPRTYIWKKHE